MRIFVTGAGGFVGGHLLTTLQRAGHEVVAASHSPWQPPVPVATEVFDVCDAASFRDVLDAHRPDGVIHLAAMASPQRSWEATDETFAVNIMGASHLLQALVDRPETRVLLVGSAQQYGHGTGSPLVETDPLQPRSPYGVSKVAQELVGALYRRHFGMPVIGARPFNHTGPGQSPDYAIGAFSSQIAEIERGLRPPRMKVGWLGSRRDYLDVRDVTAAYLLLIESGDPGEVYNIASGSAERVGDLLDILLEAAGLKDAVEVVADPEPRPGDPEVLVGDSSKLREALGWKPEIPLSTSLVDTLDWYRARG
ncbi:MAG TPA: GDP-mannose 4,6-dehydratase [Actinomycetota bacterium]|nr:GDP-mannose 4,6-dehydratase [Actinomycetota bacterium]